jgi:hypothetical protein
MGCEVTGSIPTGRLVGLQEIADFMGWSLRKTKRRVPELRRAGILYTDNIGRPPRKTYCTFTHFLYQWIILKTEKGECL